VLGALTTRLFGQPPAQLARLMLLGGVSSSEPILMWWKFVGRTHEEIAGFREEWEFGSKRFSRVEGVPRPVERILPPVPPIGIKPRLSPRRGVPSAWG
jgi:hypothetical protein